MKHRQHDKHTHNSEVNTVQTGVSANNDHSYLPPNLEENPFDPVRGEKAMWMAVITQALMDARCESKKSEAIEHKRQALTWLRGSSPDFMFVCCNANMNPSYVRKKSAQAIARGCKWRADAASKEHID